ncbi:LysR family transcriptional regulator [Halomonas sp. DP8Y7-1]|uniref:LysR family transcriptional regulator n=1 Tax=Halomonas sp. DP8Y7-1 TaxID=2859078 RepID=UPI001C9858C3|nr:LysR family transcriptional regulator [Halomonas sp. DP8Y7-1]MBY6028125.1 LysR family transcriptional regulator [Halomonas sp. DP8Y7-1]
MIPNLNDMALFVEVAKAKSFRRASEATGVPNPTISRRVSELEKAIGLRLLHRTTRKVELTEAGMSYYERCRRIIDEARLAHEQLGGMLEQPSGVLRASLPVDFAISYLSPLIAEFANLYPSITFDFDISPRAVDLISDPFDIAIRTGQLKDSQLVARLIAQLATHLYASPHYLERCEVPTSPNDLGDHACLGILKANTWTLYSQSESRVVQLGNSRFSINNMGMIRQLAVLGMGIILMPEQLVAEDVSAGRLKRILPSWQGDSIPVYGLTETRLLPAKTRCFMDFLIERLGKQKATHLPE